MFNFDPVAIAAPIQESINSFQAAASAPAVFGRIETKNITVGSASGFANPETGLTAADGQRLEVGSQTKMMTATVVLQLVGEGKINLNDLASKYLSVDTIKDIANADIATVRQLLQMTSGIANYTDIVDENGSPVFVQKILSNPDKAFNPGDALDIVRGLPPASAPGTYNYTNTNYNLLGSIIENVTKEPLAQTFETRIFKPAGMTSTDLIGNQAPADLVRGFGTGADGKLIDSTNAQWDKFAEGGVVSTPEDMIKYIKALLVDGKLLPPAQLAEMKTFLVAADSPELKLNFGLGLLEFELVGTGKFYGFNGGTLGFVSSTFMSAETGAIASTAINYADTLTAPDEIVLNLLQSIKENPNWQAIDSFNVRTDVMNIKSVSAASATLAENGDFKAKFGDVTLKLPLKLESVTTTNVKFDDGSLLIVGDNKVGTANDAKANTIDILKSYLHAINEDNQILGLGGSDILSGGNGNDKISGGNGNDFLNGRHGNDILLGGEGNDYIEGKNGNDTLDGGAGRDVLIGGSGADSFVFSSLLDSVSSRNSRDVISDFRRGEDKISLAEIDANTVLDLDQGFSFIGNAAFSGKAGELHYVAEKRHGNFSSVTILEGDTNGDGRADFQIELTGNFKFDAVDFIL